MTKADDRKARAGAFVLGLMSDEERALALIEIEQDPKFRDLVTRLSHHMHALDDTAIREPLPEGLWERIEARLGPAEAVADRDDGAAGQAEALPATAPLAPQPVADDSDRQAVAAQVPPPAADVVDFAAARERARPVGAASLGGWRGGLLAASILAACGLGFMVGRFTLPPPSPVVVVVLADEDANPGAIVEAYGNDRVRIVPLTEFDVPAGKTLEVWTLYDQTVGPVSLGTFTDPREVVLTGPDLPAPQPEQLYEITLEDAPGSPIGRPTGPILVKGLAKRPAGP